MCLEILLAGSGSLRHIAHWFRSPERTFAALLVFFPSQPGTYAEESLGASSLGQPWLSYAPAIAGDIVACRCSCGART